MNTWTVPAIVRRVIDGDTIVCDLDQGWDTWRVNQRIRLLGVDCPEMNTTEGRMAKQFTADHLPVGTEVTVVSHSLDNFGRVLGVVLLDGGTPLAGMLLAAGHAKQVKA